jgi:DNA-binding SARP family transcriptional activator
MEVRILGSVEVGTDSGPVHVATPKARAVLEVLALRADDVVPTESLIDALWGFEPPRSVAKSLQSHVSRLRRALPAGAIVTESGGYRLAVSPDQVDVHRFERLVMAGRQAVEGRDHRRAIQLLDRALDLWSGAALTELANGPLRIGQTALLEELHLTAVEARVDAHLALGHHEMVASELEALVTEHALRERFWCQLMLALYRSDRRADALAATQRLRRVLVDELGIDPSVEARELESQMLTDDPALELQSPGPPNTIPTPLTSFVGRDRQRRQVGKLLREHRLVTLLGPGRGGQDPPGDDGCGRCASGVR